MNEIKLLPCPFCDNEVEYHPASHHMNNFWNKNTIYCPTCDFMMEGSSTVHLVKRWNTRKPMERIIDRLEEEKDYMEVYSWSGARCPDEVEIIKLDKAISVVKEEGGFYESN